MASKSLRAIFAEVLGIRTNVSWYATNFPHVDKARIRREYAHYFKFGVVRNPWDRVASVYFGKVRPGKCIAYMGRFLYCPIDIRWFYKLLSKLNVDRIHLPFMKYPFVTPGISFEDFISLVSRIPDDDIDQHLRSQYTFLVDEAGCLADFVARLETLRDDFKEICSHLQLTNFAVPKIGAAKSAQFREQHFTLCYTAESWELMRERFRKDIEMFGYDLDFSDARECGPREGVPGGLAAGPAPI